MFPKLTFVEIVVLLMVAGLVSLFVLDWHAGYRGERDGRRDALADIDDEKLIIKSGGKRKPWTDTFQTLCRDRYNVDVQRFSGCVPTIYQMHYKDAYNQVMLAHIASAAPDFDQSNLLDEAYDQWIATVSP